MSQSTDLHDENLIMQLKSPQAYDHKTEGPQVVETHISYVALTGNFAYKIKKPVNFGFLDYSTLEKREYFCQKELEINSPWSENLYLEVIPVRKKGNELKITHEEWGEIINYAVKMNQFDQGLLFLKLLQKNELERNLIIKSADFISSLHTNSEVVHESPFGTWKEIWETTAENNFALSSFKIPTSKPNQLAELQKKQEEFLKGYRDLFEKRVTEGKVRSCHGDLHLNNMVLYKGRPTLFDGIEFNAEFSNIDVLYDFSFLMMDLISQGRRDFAFLLLNHYLELSGDYTEIPLVPFYCSLRAAIRAKVAGFKWGEMEEGREKIQHEYQHYLDVALEFLDKKSPHWVLVSGPSGSGKSTLGEALGEQWGAVHLRSDAIRKHLLGIPISQHGGAKAYTPEMHKKTYQRLFSIAKLALSCGFKVIIDATFTKKDQREQLEELKDFPGFKFLLKPDKKTCEQRILKRKHDVSDADIKILNAQWVNYQWPKEEEGFFYLGKEKNLTELLQSSLNELNKWVKDEGLAKEASYTYEVNN